MASEKNDRDVFNASGMEKAERIGLTSTPEGNSMTHPQGSQEVANYDHLMEKGCSNVAMMTKEKHKKPELVANEDCSSDLQETSSATERFKENATTKTWDQSIQLKHQVRNSSKSMGNEIKDIEDRFQIAAQAYPNDTNSLRVMETLPGKHLENESGHIDDMNKSRIDAGFAVETSSEIRSENKLEMFATHILDNTPALLSITDESTKDIHRQKAALAYAPPCELPTQEVQTMEATIPPGLEPGIGLAQTIEEFPGAYPIVPSGAGEESTRFPLVHESWPSRYHFDEATQQPAMGNNPVEGHQNDGINIDQAQIGTNENDPVEAEPVEEAIFAEVVRYRQPMYRWILVVVVVLVVAIIVLGVRLGGTSSASTPVPTLAPTPAPTRFPTLEQTPAPTLTPTPAPTSEETPLPTLTPTPLPTLPLTPTSNLPDAERIACFFLDLTIDSCRETTSASLPDGTRTNSTIPSELGVLTQLTYLDLSDNQLSGTIPSEIGAMTSLTNLNLYKNQLTGTIPSEIRAITSLDYLSLSWNQLTGTIPSEIMALTNLAVWHLYMNQLTGTIPSEIGALTSLTSFHLYSNKLTGTIPSELSNLKLTSMEMYNNSLSGTISTELCQSRANIFIDCGEIECSCCLSMDEISGDETPCK